MAAAMWLAAQTMVREYAASPQNSSAWFIRLGSDAPPARGPVHHQPSYLRLFLIPTVRAYATNCTCPSSSAIQKLLPRTLQIALLNVGQIMCKGTVEVFVKPLPVGILVQVAPPRSHPGRGRTEIANGVRVFGSGIGERLIMTITR